jgi:hypothetical protein
LRAGSNEDERQVRTEAERYVRNFLDFNASAIDSLAHCKEELTATGYGFYASGAVFGHKDQVDVELEDTMPAGTKIVCICHRPLG